MAEKEGLGRIASHLLFPLLIGNLITIAVSGLMVIVLARLLGPSSYGLYTLAVSFYLLIDSVQNLGVGSYFNKYLAEYTDSGSAEKIGQTIVSGYIVLLVAAALLTLFALAISPYFANVLYKSTGIQTFTLQLASITIFFFIVSSATYSALIGIRKGRLAAAVSVVTNVSEFVVAVSLVYLGYGVNGALAGLIIGYVFGVCIGISSLYVSLRKKISTKLRFPVMEEVKHALNFAIPLAGKNFLSNFTYYLAVLVAGLYVTTAILGNYGAAIKGVGVLQAIYGNVTTVLLPTFSVAIARMVAKRSGNRNQRNEVSDMYNKAIFFSLLVSLPVIIYIGAMSKPLIFLLLGSKYSIAPVYLTLITIGVVMNVMGLYTSSLFVASGHIVKALKYELISDIIAILMLFALAPQLGVIGSIAAVFFIGSLANTYQFVNGARKLFGARLGWGKISRLLIASLIFGALLWLLSLSNINYQNITGIFEAMVMLIIGIGLTVLVLPAFLVALGATTPADIKYLGHATQKLYVVNRFFAYIAGYFTFLFESFRNK